MRRIRRITLRDFRSYSSLDLSLDGRSVALFGPNGAGKTNLIEALSLMSPGRGLRRATLAEMRRQGSDGTFGIGLGVGAVGEEPTTLSLSVPVANPPKKALRIDGHPVPSAAAILEYFAVGWLTPAQDRLFMDGASERRRFVDRMTLAQDPVHAVTSGTYEKALKQRQLLLSEGRGDDRLLSVLERQMAEAGVAIAAARLALVASLRTSYRALRQGAFPAAAVEMVGELERALTTDKAAAVEDRFAADLARHRPRDREAGRPVTGPHRSDLQVIHAEKDQAAKLCSTGEQKALLIGLVLAHAAGHRAAAEAPLILLLDEVAAHLDGARRAALADILETLGCHVFMTGTDRELFDAWGERVERFVVEDNQVRPFR